MHPPLLRATMSGLAVALGLALAPGLGTSRGAAPRRPVQSTLAEVAALAIPVTVAISGERGPPTASGLDELRQDLGLREVTPASGVATSTGSGVIVRSSGLVLTNHHVIAATQALSVTLHDQRRVPARVLASDPRTDIALLQLEGPGPFPAAPIGDSDDLRVGDEVLAVGHPFEFTFSATSGIISATGRRALDQDEIQDFLQIDAAVNPGVSGGPLFDTRGTLVGLVTAVYTAPTNQGHQASGLSFAIPINMAMRIADDLQAVGHARRPYAGLTLSDADQGGARVSSVTPGSPAARAGLEAEDRIVAADGSAVEGRVDLEGRVSASRPGAILHLEVERQGRRRPAELRLADASAPLADLPSAPVASWRGVTLAAYQPELARAFGVTAPDPAVGLLVIAVARGSPGDIAGLRPGDLISKFGETNVQTLDALTESSNWPSVLILQVWRIGGTITVAIHDRA